MSAKAFAFSSDLRPFLLALGEAWLPSAWGMPGYDEASLERLEGFVGGLGGFASEHFVWSAKALRLRLGAGRWLSHQAKVKAIRRHLSKLPAFGALERQWLKSLGLPIKLSHHDSQATYQAVGMEYPKASKGYTAGSSLPGVIGQSDLQELQAMEVDAIVVGSGAGGAVAAYEIAAAGGSVLIVEEGDFFPRSSFTAKSADAVSRLYRNQGLAFTLGDPPIYLPTGRTVGGTTTINSGTCFRPPERVLQRWQAMGLEGWGAKDLEPHLQKVERILEVERARPAFLGQSGHTIALGCDRLGYPHQPLLRNAPACDGQGVCVFGCPTDAKRSTNVSYIPLALRHGAALSPKTRFLGATSQGGRISACRLLHLPSNKVFTIPCKRLILAAGSLRTPLLLKELGCRHPALGRNLSIHPAASVLAEIPGEAVSPKAIPQGYSIEAFHEQGLLFEGASVPPEVLAGASFLWGEELQEQLSRYRNLVSFGFLIEDEGKGRVWGEIKDFSLIRYPLGAKERLKLHRGLEILSGVFLAAGASRVWPQIQDALVLRDHRDLRAFAARSIEASRLELSAYHPLGTARMASEPSSGVVDPRGKVFGWQNLYVVDGSILPTSPAVNPQVTIMAAATYIASNLLHDGAHA